MHSIHRALLWETFAKGWWTIPLFFAVGISMPMITNAALSSVGLPWTEPIWLSLQIAFLHYLVIASSVGIIDAQGTATRLYAAPISNRTIVLWHGLTGALFLAVEVALFSALANALFRSNWPILGPSLAAAACWGLAQPLVHSAKRTIAGTILACVPLVLFEFWLHARFGNWFSKPTHSWDQVTASEVLTMIGMLIFAYFHFMFVIGKDRCGESILPLEDWFASVRAAWSRGVSEAKSYRPFRSQSSALFWYEWKQKGISLPIISLVFFTLLGSIVAMKLASKQIDQELFENLRDSMFGFGMFFIGISGVSGLFFAIATVKGKADPSAGQFVDGLHVYDLGSFQSTKPVASRQLAYALLKTCGLSVLLTWLVWVLAFLSVVACSVIMQQPIKRIAPEVLGVWFFPMVLVFSWVALTVVTLIGICGRGVNVITYGSLALTLYGVLSFVFGMVASAELVVWARWGSIGLMSVATIVYCVLTTTIALKRGLVSYAMLYVMMGVSAGLLVTIIAIAPTMPSNAAWLAILALVSLVVHPLAAFPLAFASNRTR